VSSLTLSEKNTPEFCIIGAQKAGTGWLWAMLDQHPGTSLPEQKEIHYFGSSELYAKGDDWYLNYFKGLDPDKVIGEASTTYFYDRVPYWYNDSTQIEFDDSLPLIPELISQKFPDMKFIVILRDPVRRAISAYSHWMRKGKLSPLLGLKKVATEHPKTRILEYGFYAKYLNVWMNHIPSDRLRVIIFEDQIKKNYDQTLVDTYEYLGLDPDFRPEMPNKPVHKSWGWTRIVFNYYTGKIFKDIGYSKAGSLLNRFDVLSRYAIKAEDIEFLRSAYLPEKEEISTPLNNPLTCWDYGEAMLHKLKAPSR
jgi:hypothetical protein